MALSSIRMKKILMNRSQTEDGIFHEQKFPHDLFHTVTVLREHLHLTASETSGRDPVCSSLSRPRG